MILENFLSIFKQLLILFAVWLFNSATGQKYINFGLRKEKETNLVEFCHKFSHTLEKYY